MSKRSPERPLTVRLLEQLWLPVLAVVLWFAASAGSTNFYFPSLSTILGTLWSKIVDGPLMGDTYTSVRNILAGIAISTVLGVVFGAVIGEVRFLDRTTAPLLNLFRATPTVAFVPVIILSLGIGAAPKIFLIVLGTVWPVLLNTISGVRGINPAVHETARSYRIPWRLRMVRVTIPAALPQVFAGVRVALSVAVVLMVVSEIYGSASGLGYFILKSGSAFRVADTWAGTLLIGVIGYLLSVVLLIVEHAALGWYFERAPRARRRRVPQPIGVNP